MLIELLVVILRSIFKIKCLVLLIIVSLNVNAQVKRYEIEMRINAVTDINHDVYIHIFKNKRNIKVVYSKIDSLKYQEVRKDPEWLKYADVQRTPEVVKELSEIKKKHYSITKDSLLLRSNETFSKLLDSFYIADDKLLMNEEVANKRSFLDGVSVTITKSTNSGIDKKLYFDTPDIQTNPEAYRLITYSLNLYRERHKSSFLDKRFTYGY